MGGGSQVNAPGLKALKGTRSSEDIRYKSMVDLEESPYNVEWWQGAENLQRNNEDQIPCYARSSFGARMSGFRTHRPRSSLPGDNCDPTRLRLGNCTSSASSRRAFSPPASRPASRPRSVNPRDDAPLQRQSPDDQTANDASLTPPVKHRSPLGSSSPRPLSRRNSGSTFHRPSGGGCNCTQPQDRPQSAWAAPGERVAPGATTPGPVRTSADSAAQTAGFVHPAGSPVWRSPATQTNSRLSDIRPASARVLSCRSNRTSVVPSAEAASKSPRTNRRAIFGSVSVELVEEEAIADAQPTQANPTPELLPAARQTTFRRVASSSGFDNQRRPRNSTGGYFGMCPPVNLGDGYCPIKILGRGTSATVWETIEETSRRRWAVKVFDKDKPLWQSRHKQAVREFRLLEGLTHPAIIKAQWCFDRPSKFCIVFEFIDGGSLRQLLRQNTYRGLGEERSLRLFRQVCEGVSFCHARLVAHRDLKLENLLLDASQSTVKIIDFGFAVQLKSAEQRLRAFCGTPSYMAPEIVHGKSYSGFSTDVWALGVVLYALLSSRFPFEAATESQLYAKVRRGAFIFPDSIGPLSKRAITACMRMDDTGRPSVNQLLAHSLLSDISPL